ncbi:MAG: LuxR C-terminal-related transcriptional regulator [Nocardioidaceae bacterium]
MAPDDPGDEGGDTVELLRATREFIALEEDVRQRCVSGRLPAGVRWVGRSVGQVRARLMAFRPRVMESLVPMMTPDVLEQFGDYDRRLIEEGVERIDLYNPDGMWGDTAKTLATSPILPYARFATVTVQIKIYDRRAVVIEGPRIDGDRSALVVTRADVVDAARGLFSTALATSVPAAAAISDDPRPWLTSRQREVVALLTADLHDDEIAHELGVSVRTVRGDIEVVRRVLGVRTRFAAGFQLGRLVSATGLPTEPEESS